MDQQVQEIANLLELSDNVCIKNFCENRDEQAFSELVNRYKNSIRRIIYTTIRGPIEDIEDVEQEILFSLYKNLNSFSFESDFKTYLFRVSRNKAIDFIRKRNRIITIENRAKKNWKNEDLRTPECLFIQESKRDEVRKAVFRLSEKDRSLIIMKDVEDLNISEIAKVFNRPEGTIKSRLHRARKRAAEILMEEINR